MRLNHRYCGLVSRLVAVLRGTRWVAAIGILAGWGTPPPSIKDHVQGTPGALYESMFQVGHTWRFRVKVTEHLEQDAKPETRKDEPVRCTVTRVRRLGVARLAHVKCTPTDEFDDISAGGFLEGTYLSNPEGFWRLEGPPETADEISKPSAAFAVLPAIPTPIRRKTRQSPPCDYADTKGPLVGVGENRELYSVAPWGEDAWCATRVVGCYSNWYTECFRQDVGWIGGAMRGYVDPTISEWTEVRWGEAPRFPFGS